MQRAFACLKRIVAFLLTASAVSHANAQPSAQAGWAEVEITPPLGIALGGRGGPITLAKRVLDPLYAQVLFLKDTNGTGFILVSLDLVGLTRELADSLRTTIVQETGVDWNLVVFNCSHTHSGPYMIRSLMAGVESHPKIETDYFEFLTKKMVSTTRTAEKSLKAVDVQIFKGKSQLAINRRGKNRKGEIAMLPNASGPIDERLWVMKLTPKDSSAPAVVFSYACHPVITYGFDYAAISADFPGVARDSLKTLCGDKTHAQFVQGFAGNVRPRILADIEKNQFRRATSADLKKAGTELAGAVQAALKSDGESISLNIAGASDRPFLPRAEPPERAYFEKMRTQALATTNRYRLAVSEHWLKRTDSGEPFSKGDAWPLGLIRLTDKHWIAVSGGEPVVEWRQKFEEWLAPRNVVTFGYAEARSYLPTESLLTEGGYEVLESNENRASSPAPFSQGIEDAIRKSLLRQLAFIESVVK